MIGKRANAATNATNSGSLDGAKTLVTLWTVHDVTETGVGLSLAEFKEKVGIAGTNISTLAAALRTIDGVTYADDNAYNDAYWSQGNFEAILRVLSTKGVINSVYSAGSTATAASPTADFANVFLGGADKFGTDVVEANAPVWKIVVDLKGEGAFDILNDLDGTAVTVTSNTTAVETDVAGSAKTAGAAAAIAISDAKQSIVVESIELS